MPEASLTVVFLGMSSLCLVATTLTIMVTARDVRQTLRRANAMLPDAQQTLSEARHSLQTLHRIFKGATQAAEHVEVVVHQACESASDTLDRLAVLKGRVGGFWTEQFGNGTRAEPRRHHRGR